MFFTFQSQVSDTWKQLTNDMDTMLTLHSLIEIHHLPATTGDFRSSRSWMEVLAVTTLLLLTVPVRRNKTKHDDENEDSHRAYVKRVMVLVCSHQFCRLLGLASQNSELGSPVRRQVLGGRSSQLKESLHRVMTTPNGECPAASHQNY